MREERNQIFTYGIFLLVVLLMNGIEGMNFKWIGGSSCGDVWGPQTPSTCWSPSGYPGTSEGGDSVVFPPYSNITLYAGPAYERNVGNGIHFTSYSWAGCYSIILNSLYLSENSNFTLSNTFNLVVNDDFYIQENSNFVMSTADSSLIANSDVYLAGNIYSFGAVINGRGKLHILNSGSLIFDQPNVQYENFLLIDTDVHGQLVQKEGSIIHTGFWWQESPSDVIITVFSTLSLSGYFYDWEEKGALVVVEGGSLTLGQVEMRGVSLQNYGNLELGEFYSSNEVIPLNSAIQNFGLIHTDKLYNHLFYETTNLTNIGGVISSTSELTINCPLSDVGGTFVSNEHAEISFASGIFIPPYQSSEYYGGVSFTGSTGSFNGTSLTGSGLFYISAPPIIYEEGLFINSNVALDYIVADEENVIYTRGDIYIYRGTLFASGSIIVPNNTIEVPEIHVYGNLDIVESLTFSTNVTILIHTGGTMKIANSATVNMLNGATIQYCGGNLLLEGVLNGSVVKCSTSYLDSTFSELEEHFRRIDQRLQSYHLV